MSDKPDLVLINMEPINKLTRESFDDFKELISHDGLKPSDAIQKIMGKYNCNKIDTSSVIRLVEYAYSEIDISRNSFTFKIHDSGYPNTKKELNDENFNEEIRSLPPMKW